MQRGEQKTWPRNRMSEEDERDSTRRSFSPGRMLTPQRHFSGRDVDDSTIKVSDTVLPGNPIVNRANYQDPNEFGPPNGFGLLPK